tara:strand:- start:18 stop:734 length:717 start_codon:yes stop_codon:yes gene_type:complete
VSFFVVIPARYDSRRLPGKPLVDIAGIPMIQYVYESAKKSSAEDVIVATDDSRILEAVEKFGGKALLTSKDHRSGTERVQEVANQLDFSLNDIVVNVQGDEPLIPPAAIDIVAAALNEKKEFGIATLCESATEDIENPNIVKVVMNSFGEALYFSRSPIPYSTNSNNYFRHIGLYAYRVDALNQFVNFPASMCEDSENLEQLKALDFGLKIHVTVCEFNIPPGVDTPKDLNAVRALIP